MSDNITIDHLKLLAETDFTGACIWAENNIPSLKSYFDTWASNCGAPRSVLIGHTIRAIVDIELAQDETKGE